jgi:hypothetical protein
MLEVFGTLCQSLLLQCIPLGSFIIFPFNPLMMAIQKLLELKWMALLPNVPSHKWAYKGQLGLILSSIFNLDDG